MLDMFNLEGKVAIVTGANGGIGLGIAKGLGRAGAKIVNAARNKEKSLVAEQTLAAEGSEMSTIITDIRDPEQCKALVAETVKLHGRVDILVNNSGINFRKQPQNYTLEEWHDVMDTNLTAAFILSQAVYPHFLKQGGGKIINVGSLMSFMGGPVAVAYGSSKGGIVQLGKALAVAWAKDNIQVNALLPGWIDTPLSVKSRAAFPDLEKSVIERTPAGRWGDPEDFAGSAVYYASKASDFVTGTSVVVDGGYSIKA